MKALKSRLVIIVMPRLKLLPRAAAPAIMALAVQSRERLVVFQQVLAARRREVLTKLLPSFNKAI